MTSSTPLGDRRITFDQLRGFILIAEASGFQHAATRLGRSQSAITQSLKRLEDIVGCRLVERRQGRVVGLTPDGERFLPAAIEIVARASEAVSAMQKPQITGQIVLGVPDDFQIFDLHGAVSRASNLNPRLRIEVRSALSSDILQMFDRGDLELAIVKRVATDPIVQKSKASHLLRKEPLYWIANEKRSLESLNDLPLAIFPEGCSYRRVALEAVASIGKNAYSAYTSASYENIRSAVSAGLAIGVLPRSALSKDHVILSDEEGFPSLPDVHLIMIQATRCTMVNQLAEFLQYSTVHP
ncbi:LysR family transcriptional regulator [Rhodovulum sulfidophilum]|uniref:LysR family transcriptional regulator n=1 Tax=Rhodovulum sulfidophilum TaxID=35806 RepID=UPI001F2EF60F|nr:LysR family transcriptional regulator [Rhodovulum sulfidophilum]MCE8439353.1 LysR family transcriptional regulator [Rhodovulum sulfidophilum]